MITILGSQSCHICLRVKEALAQASVPFTYIDIDKHDIQLDALPLIIRDDKELGTSEIERITNMRI